MSLENPLERHPFGRLMSLAGIQTTEVAESTSRLLHPEIVSKYADRFALQVSRLGNKLIDSFRGRLGKTVILTMLRGGLYTGLDLASFIKTKTDYEIPVAGIRVLYKEDSGLRITTAWSTVKELLEKYPDARNYFLVDGWVGTGMNIRMTQLMLQSAFKDLTDNRVDINSVSPIDPVGVCDYSLRQDILNPYHVEDNDSLGVYSPVLTNGKPMSAINTNVDRAALLDPIEDFMRRAYRSNSPFYLNQRPEDVPNLGQNFLSWGLGINEALNRSHGDHIVIATPPIIPLLEDLRVRNITGPATLPFHWLAVSVSEKDLS